jgi:endonuclease/exonuclease/phosphatase (EEP) superfamily protein YafD
MAKQEPPPFTRHCGFAFLLFSGCLWIATTACFLGTWDEVAAITVFPQWTWALLGVLSAALAMRLLRSVRLILAITILWVLTTLAFADNLLPVIRSLQHGSAPPIRVPGTLRIATLNCASSPAAAAEVMQFQPDIVLLQEIPPTNQLAQFARDWFGDTGSFVLGFDCAILSRFLLKPIDERPATHHTRAILVLPDDRELLVTSLRLTPPLGRMDLWNPAAWRNYTRDRQQRRRELRSVLDAQPTKPELPNILGGDFNAPAGDAIYKILGQYRDAHRAVGRGWGNTALNNMPWFRPDQIWLKGLAPLSSRAVRTIHSDHRMVVTDALLQSQK